ncbi:MAG: hypothetical protein ACLFP2_05255 [Candidatus Woesearchaeota archaeon]
MVKDDNIAGALAYLLVGIIWFFADEKMKKSRLAKFHVKQAINLYIFAACLSFVAGLLIITVFLIPIIHFLTLIAGLIGIIHSLNRHKTPIPVIGKFAERYLNF